MINYELTSPPGITLTTPQDGTLYSQDDVNLTCSAETEPSLSDPATATLTVSVDFDVDNDGDVDMDDLILVSADFRKTPTTYDTDLNNDGKVNIIDMILVGKNFS